MKVKTRKRSLLNLKETWKNKLVAMLLLVASLLSVFLLNDITALVFFGLVAIMLFFADENVICI